MGDTHHYNAPSQDTSNRQLCASNQVTVTSDEHSCGELAQVLYGGTCSESLFESMVGQPHRRCRSILLVLDFQVLHDIPDNMAVV